MCFPYGGSASGRRNGFPEKVERKEWLVRWRILLLRAAYREPLLCALAAAFVIVELTTILILQVLSALGIV